MLEYPSKPAGAKTTTDQPHLPAAQQASQACLSPYTVRTSAAPGLIGSSMIFPEHAQWLRQMGVTDVVSLEAPPARTEEVLRDLGIRHHSLPIMDADDGPYFSVFDTAMLLRLASNIYSQQPDAVILIHCAAGEARAAEALEILRHHLTKRLP